MIPTIDLGGDSLPPKSQRAKQVQRGAVGSISVGVLLTLLAGAYQLGSGRTNDTLRETLIATQKQAEEARKEADLAKVLTEVSTNLKALTDRLEKVEKDVGATRDLAHSTNAAQQVLSSEVQGLKRVR